MIDIIRARWLGPGGLDGWRIEPGPFTAIPQMPGSSMASAMRAFAAAAPWRATAHAMTLVGSHDTVRIRTMLDGEDLVTVAFGLLATMPGIPMLWSGDEIGQHGVNGEDGRRPFPWQDPAQWDQDRLATIRAHFGARADSEALRHGGLRWLAVSDDAVTFLREAPEESVLVHASRADHDPTPIPAAVVGEHLAGLAGTDDLSTRADGLHHLPTSGPAIGIWRCHA